MPRNLPVPRPVPAHAADGALYDLVGAAVADGLGEAGVPQRGAEEPVDVLGLAVRDAVGLARLGGEAQELVHPPDGGEPAVDGAAAQILDHGLEEFNHHRLPLGEGVVIFCLAPVDKLPRVAVVCVYGVLRVGAVELLQRLLPCDMY